MTALIFRWCVRSIGALGILIIAGPVMGLPSTSSRNDTATSKHHSDLIAMGERLFSDTRLSLDGKVSCASCHIPTKYFADGRQVAIGINGKAGTRNTPSLASIGRSAGPTFFWDGRRTRLEQAVMDPFTNPVEMGLPDDSALLGKLNAIPSYNDSMGSIAVKERESRSLARIAQALSAYVRSVDRTSSSFDRYTSGQDPKALNAQERRGLAVFENKGHCAQCHQLEGNPPSLTDHSFHRTGVGFSAVEYDLPRLTAEVIEHPLQGADLGNRVATNSAEAQLGRFNVSHEVADMGMFRTPSLRGVAKTAPYMHDGSVKTLEEAVDREIYYRSLDSGQPIGLTVEERAELLAFLRKL